MCKPRGGDGKEFEMEDIILWCYSAFMLTCIVLGTYWDYKNHHGMYWDGVKWVKRDEK